MGNEIKKINDVSDINVLGGRSKEVKVLLDKQKMAENHVDFLSISKMIQAGNIQFQSGNLLQKDTAYSVETGNFLTNAEDVSNLVVGINQQQPVYLKQIATVEEGPETSNQYVLFGYGKASANNLKSHPSNYPAITISVAKKKGADAMKLSEEIIQKIAHLKKDLIPNEVQVTTTRNYGETASAKVSELLFHLFISIVVVTLFVMLAMELERWFSCFLICTGNICTYLVQLLFHELYLE